MRVEWIGFGLAVAAIAQAGCVSPEKPGADPAATASENPAPLPPGTVAVNETAQPDLPDAPREFRVQTVELSGTIVLRPAGDPVYQGDPPYFRMLVPNGTRYIKANGEWSPPQQMGLEFHPPDGERITSWNGLVDAITTINPPIEMRIDAPVGGDWYVYFGPGVVGGLVTWTLKLELEIPANQTVELVLPH